MRKGRPTLFTPDAAQLFIRARGLGATIPVAAGAAGWSEGAAKDYLARGEAQKVRAEAGEKLTAQEKAYADFSNELARARASLQQAALARIVSAVQAANHRESVSAAMWLLERLWPSEYGRRMVEVSGPSGAPVPVEVRVSGVEESLRDFQAGLEAGADAGARKG